MEPDERHHHHHHHQEHHLTSPYYHPFHHHTPTTVSAAPSYNGNMPPPPPPNDGSSSSYHHSAPSSAVTAPIEPVKRKRGRPRKYDTPAQALAAKKLASSASSSSARERREQAAAAAGGVSPPSKSGSKKSISGSFGKSGQSFTPHIVNIPPGEDVAQKIILFAEQSKHELCILSASGAISDPSLSHLATGTSVSYQGQYEILSLRGSYIRGEHGGKTGGLSVCLSSSDGQIVGGGVGGLLKAAGPVQVILGTFQLERKKDGRNGVKAKQEVPQSRLTWPALLEHPFIKESLEEVEAREMHTAVVDHKGAWRLKGNGGQQRNEKCDSATPFKDASALGIVADVQSDMKSAVKVNSPSPEDFLGFPTQEGIKSSGDATLDKLENTSGTVKGAKVIGEDAKAMDLVLLSLDRCTKSLSKRDKRSCLLYSVSQNNFQFGWSSRNRFR